MASCKSPAAKAAAKARFRAWYVANRERVLAKAAAYRVTNKAKVDAAIKRWYASEHGKAKRSEYFKTYWKSEPFQKALAKYRAENVHKIRAATGRRKSERLKRIPEWLTPDDWWMIEEAYDLAEVRSKATGVEHQVDHVLPLKGRKISGLHVPTNLQVITAHANRVKHNAYDVRY